MRNATRPAFHKVLIELGPSQIDGVGVHAVAGLSPDQRIADGIADSDFQKLIPWADLGKLDEAVRAKVDAFCIGTPDGFIPPEDLDFNKLTIEWYLNHSCDGNLGFNQKGDFVARRKVEKGEELTYDYGLAESNPRFRMKCKCGAPNCRKIITGNDWRDPAFREKNLEYMLPRLRAAADVVATPPARLRRVAGPRR
ncbi:MAG: SET domain-containing protein-lysine N-methyltransferase [Candidatus Binataceae bacterium]